MWHKKCGVLGWICLFLIIVGGINWGLIGVFNFNLVAFLLGAWPIVERIVYILVGVAAIVAIFVCCRCCRCGCGRGNCSTTGTSEPPRPTTHNYDNPNNPNNRI